jgi:hypothetical protein
MRWKRGLNWPERLLAVCGYSYIEHLAIDDTLRSAAMVNACWRDPERAPLTILEIDPLTSDIAHKRLRFMKRWAFAPVRGRMTYHAGIADHALLVLGYPQAVDEAQYRRLLRIYVRW